MQNSVAKKIFAVGSAVAMTLSLAVPFIAMACGSRDGTKSINPVLSARLSVVKSAPTLPPAPSGSYGLTPGPV